MFFEYFFVILSGYRKMQLLERLPPAPYTEDKTLKRNNHETIDQTDSIIIDSHYDTY